MKKIFRCQLCETVFDGEDITYAIEVRHGQIAQYLQEVMDERYLHNCNKEAMGVGILIGVRR